MHKVFQIKKLFSLLQSLTRLSEQKKTAWWLKYSNIKIVNYLFKVQVMWIQEVNLLYNVTHPNLN